MKLLVRKSVYDRIMMSLEGEELGRLRERLLSILSGYGDVPRVSELVGEMKKSLLDPAYESVILKARAGLVARRVTATNRKTGKTYQTTVWVKPDRQNGLKRYTEQDSAGAKAAIRILRGKIAACGTPEELLELVRRNKGRFSDERGRPLPVVEELHKLVEERKGAIKSSEAQKTKRKGALKVLNGQEIHDFIEKHKTSKENERVSLGTISPEARKRIKDITGLDVERVILDSDSVRHAYNPKHNLDPNDLDDMKEIIETTMDITLSPDKNSLGNPVIIFKKEEPNGVILCEEYRAGKKELELQTAYRVKKNRQPHGADSQLPANVQNATAPTANVPQSPDSVKRILQSKEALAVHNDLLRNPQNAAKYSREEIMQDIAIGAWNSRGGAYRTDRERAEMVCKVLAHYEQKTLDSILAERYGVRGGEVYKEDLKAVSDDIKAIGDGNGADSLPKLQSFIDTLRSGNYDSFEPEEDVEPFSLATMEDADGTSYRQRVNITAEKEGRLTRLVSVLPEALQEGISGIVGNLKRHNGEVVSYSFKDGKYSFEKGSPIKGVKKSALYLYKGRLWLGPTGLAGGRRL